MSFPVRSQTGIWFLLFCRTGAITNRNSSFLSITPSSDCDTVSGDPTRPDNIVYDITNATGLQIGVSANGWGHPACSPAATAISKMLPVIP